MTESIQQQLLRVRPPRVKITYDVETGGAIEKKELPFIVGILADLKGDREDPANYDTLKARAMTDIDRDNFNDVMKTIATRVDLKKLFGDNDTLKGMVTSAEQALNAKYNRPSDDDGAAKWDADPANASAKAELNAQKATFKVLVFASIDDFEPLAVIRSLPPLNLLYEKRSQIRNLQAMAESDDSIAVDIDQLIKDPSGTGDANATASDAQVAATIDKVATKVANANGSPKDSVSATLQILWDQFKLESSNANASDLVKTKLAQAKTKGCIAVIDEIVVTIDEHLSKALSAIMHTEKTGDSIGFKQLEATWRGLHYLVFNTETSTMLKLRVFNATKEELLKDMQKAVEFDQSVLFKMIYEAEYGTYGGFPYSLLVGDYAIGNSGDDVEFIGKMAEVAASAHAPFLAQASNELFRLSGFDKLDKPRDLKKIFESGDLIGWREFREREDARYVTLCMPRALLRLPYGSPQKRNTIQCEGINFNEEINDDANPAVLSPDGNVLSYTTPDHDHFLWGNPAYLLAERITNAFALYSWTAAIRGVEGGGLVEKLPIYTYTSSNGSTELFCPTEISITDRREKELNDLGFISLCHCKGTGKAAFFSGQTTNLPKKYFSDDANANARISAMLPYMLAASRFAHYIKVIMRDKVGSFLTRANVESYLNTWIANYVLLDDNATQEVKSTYPLRSAKVVVTDVPGEPGSYKATVFLKPHFQLEELTTSIRLVADLPK